MTAVVDAPPYVQDVVLWPGLDAMGVCLCEELIRSGLPKTCFCGVVAGQVSFELTDEDTGMAWVRLVQAYPSMTFPTAAVGTRSCAAPLVAELEVGVMRCFPATRGEDPPTTQEQWDAAMLQQADMAAMYRAIQCCYGKFEEFAIGAYVPIGPEGGLVGGSWQVFIGGWKGR